MPLKNPNPFASRAEGLNAAVNPYVALMREGARDGTLPVAFGPMLEDMPGNWRARIASFHKQPEPASRLVVEIGCHKGHTLVAMAADQRDTAFVGIDITFKRVVTTSQRASGQGLKNVFTAMVNAQSIDRLFSAGEVDGVVIFFPDPWVKKVKQAKHRLVEPSFVERLRKALKPGAYVWFKSDQELYFNEARAAFEGAGFLPVSAGAGLPAVDYTSTFEQRFQAQNLPTYSGKWLTPPAASPESAVHLS